MWTKYFKWFDGNSANFLEAGKLEIYFTWIYMRDGTEIKSEFAVMGNFKKVCGYLAKIKSDINT